MLEIDGKFKETREKGQRDKIQQEARVLKESIDNLKVINSDLQLRVETREEIMEGLRKKIAKKKIDFQQIKDSNKQVNENTFSYMIIRLRLRQQESQKSNRK